MHLGQNSRRSVVQLAQPSLSKPASNSSDSGSHPSPSSALNGAGAVVPRSRPVEFSDHTPLDPFEENEKQLAEAKETRDLIHANQLSSSATMKAIHDANIEVIEYQVGDLVAVKVPGRGHGRQRPRLVAKIVRVESLPGPRRIPRYRVRSVSNVSNNVLTWCTARCHTSLTKHFKQTTSTC